jgi:hypothetical protein
VLPPPNWRGNCRVQHLAALVGDGEAGPVPGLHTPGKDAYGGKAVFPQPLCRSARAALARSDRHDSPLAVGNEFGVPVVEFGPGEQHGSADVSEFADKLLGAAHIEDKRRGILG